MDKSSGQVLAINVPEKRGIRLDQSRRFYRNIRVLGFTVSGGCHSVLMLRG